MNQTVTTAGPAPGVTELPRYVFDAERMRQFQSLLVLGRMILGGEAYAFPLSGDDMYLDKLLDKLFVDGYVAFSRNRRHYVPTNKGRRNVEIFLQRFYEYVKVYDVYCAVNLQTGEWGFSRFYELKPLGEATWQNHLHTPGFQDLRVAVAQYKKLDPIEIIFMDFFKRQMFAGNDQQSWQCALFTGSIFDEMMTLVNDQISWTELDKARPSNDTRIKNLIRKGSDLMIELLKAPVAEEAPPQDDSSEVADSQEVEEVETVTQTTTVEEVVEYVEVVEPIEVTYTDDYFLVYQTNPFYVAPFWLTPWYF